MFLEDQNIGISKKELREMFLDVMMEFESKKEKEKEKEKEMYEKINEIHDFLKGRGDINNNKNNGDSQWTKNVKFSISQIADYLDIKSDTVRKIIKRYDLKFEFVKGKIVFSHEVADKIIEYKNNKRKKRIIRLGKTF